MSDYKTISILITALGGEGGGTLMNWIIECARSQKLFVQGTSVPGVAQRTGSTSYYIEICDRNFDNEKEPILSLYPKPGRVDIRSFGVINKFDTVNLGDKLKPVFYIDKIL